MCLDLCVGCLVGLRLSLKGALVYPTEQDPSRLKGSLVSSDPGASARGRGGGGCVQCLISFINALHVPGRHFIHFRVLGRLLWEQFLPAFSLGTETSHGLW